MGMVIKEENNKKVEVPGQQCFPLFSYIMALDFPTINLLRWFYFYKNQFFISFFYIYTVSTLREQNMRCLKQFPGTRWILKCYWLSWYMPAVTSMVPGRKSTSSYYQWAMSTLEQFVWFLTTSIFYIIFIFSAADDVFVRKDLLKTKYDFVDFAGAEKYNNWCNHYSQCTVSCKTISMKMASHI